MAIFPISFLGYKIISLDKSLSGSKTKGFFDSCGNIITSGKSVNNWRVNLFPKEEVSLFNFFVVLFY